MLQVKSGQEYKPRMLADAGYRASICQYKWSVSIIRRFTFSVSLELCLKLNTADVCLY